MDVYQRELQKRADDLAEQAPDRPRRTITLLEPPPKEHLHLSPS